MEFGSSILIEAQLVLVKSNSGRVYILRSTAGMENYAVYLSGLKQQKTHVSYVKLLQQNLKFRHAIFL